MILLSNKLKERFSEKDHMHYNEAGEALANMFDKFEPSIMDPLIFQVTSILYQSYRSLVGPLVSQQKDSREKETVE